MGRLATEPREARRREVFAWIPMRCGRRRGGHWAEQQRCAEFWLHLRGRNEDAAELRGIRGQPARVMESNAVGGIDAERGQVQQGGDIYRRSGAATAEGIKRTANIRQI